MIELFDKYGELKPEYSIPYIKSCFSDECIIEAYSKELFIHYKFPIIHVKNILDNKMHHYQVYNYNILIEEYHTNNLTNISECPFGLYRSWYPNGIPELIQTYDDTGHLTGLTRKYYDNGQLEYMGLIEYDVWKGEFKNWDRDGKLITFEYRIGGNIFEINQAKKLYKDCYKELPKEFDKYSFN